jgi:deazaflavin-dependent oxidoreductase (nitroreductase family)
MAKTYRLTFGARLINWLFRVMTRLGASYRHILTVAGRKTGRLYSTSVGVIELGGHCWLVAGYGPANWVRNARAAGEVTLSRGRRSEKFKVRRAWRRDRRPGGSQVHGRDSRHPPVFRRHSRVTRTRSRRRTEQARRLSPGVVEEGITFTTTPSTQAVPGGSRS